MVPFKSSDTGFLFAFHSNYGPVLYQFQDKVRYSSKIAIFIPPAFGAPSSGFRTEYCHNVWCVKTRMVT